MNNIVNPSLSPQANWLLVATSFYEGAKYEHAIEAARNGKLFNDRSVSQRLNGLIRNSVFALAARDTVRDQTESAIQTRLKQLGSVQEKDPNRLKRKLSNPSHEALKRR